MNFLELVNPARYFLDIGPDTLRAFDGSRTIELPVEQLSDGKLSETCKQNLISELQKFISRKPWQPRPRAFCAITARGVSLRRLSLPGHGKDELHRILPLQIEREFPLAPDQLAWGTQSLNGVKGHGDGAGSKREVLVAAVKKDCLAEYAAIICACGANPVFTLAALARSYVCPQPPGAYAVLSVGRTCSELITIEAGVPGSVRVLAWGLRDLAAAQRNPRAGDANAPAPTTGYQAHASFGGSGPAANECPAFAPVDPLVNLLNRQSLAGKIFITGIPDGGTNRHFSEQLARALGPGVDCQPVELSPGVAGSEAIVGMQRVVNGHSALPPLVLQLKQIDRKVQLAQEAPVKLAGLVLGIAAMAVLLPFFEAVVLKSHVAHRLEAINTDAGRFTTIDRELDFLQYLKENEPPYVDAFLVLAKAAPPGTRFDSVSMNRRGEISLRGSLRDGQQVAELRSKLVDSGFFASVGIEEQTPSPDRQKVSVRMSAQWKPANLRKAPPPEPPKPAADSKPGMPSQAGMTSASPEKPAGAQKSSSAKTSRN